MPEPRRDPCAGWQERAFAAEAALAKAEALIRALEQEQDVSDWGFTPCDVCGSGTLYGSRHLKCAEALAKAEADRGQTRQDGPDARNRSQDAHERTLERMERMAERLAAAEAKEAVAVNLLDDVRRNPCKCSPPGSGEEFCTGHCWISAALAEAEARCARIRRETVEECAKVAEGLFIYEESDQIWAEAARWASKQIAKDIRAPAQEETP